MKKTDFALVAAMSWLSASANAGLLDFAAMANGAGGYGESAFSPFVDVFDTVTVTVSGLVSGQQRFAYLDANVGGLGVCGGLNSNASTGKQGSSKANLCSPGSDDNVTTNESLVFNFNQDVIVTNIWFNNNHDGGFSSGDLVNIDDIDFNAVTGLAGDPNAYGTFLVAANQDFTIKYVNQSFYISALTFESTGTVQTQGAPVPNVLALMLLGLVGIGAAKARADRRRDAGQVVRFTSVRR